MTDSMTLSIAYANDASEQVNELSDSDLEQVVGGLARVWNAAHVNAEPAPALFSVTSIASMDARQRISA